MLRRHSHWLSCRQIEEPRTDGSGDVPRASDRRCSADDQQPAQILVAHLDDTSEPFLTAAGVLKRRQPKPGGELRPAIIRSSTGSGAPYDATVGP